MAAIRVICLALAFSALPPTLRAESFSDALHAYLQHSIESDGRKFGIVVGMVDERGSSIVSFGTLDDDSRHRVDGDTLFEMGSDTKTFTALLLEDMVARGQMKLDDPVAKYLPASVRMPTRHGRQITLRQLATHFSGLPSMPGNFAPAWAENPYANYTVDDLYQFLSNYQLTRDPGKESEYSNLGMGLLGHAIALKAGAGYESLVVACICDPLKMDSTRITLTPQLQARFATAHNQFGDVTSAWDLPTLAGAGALRSTANDMLKYVSANLGLSPSKLTPLMQKAQAEHLAWFTKIDPQGRQLVWHGGGTGGFRSFVGFDKTRRRGIVVLSNIVGIINVEDLGWFALSCPWDATDRPTTRNTSGTTYVGRYRRSGLKPNAPAEPEISVCREGERLFVQTIGPGPLPASLLLPPGSGEIVPESGGRFVERMSGTAITFARDSLGAGAGDSAVAYDRISDQPPQPPQRPRPPTIVKLSEKLLDACVGDYEFPPDAVSAGGFYLTVRREGDRLIGQARGEKVLKGAFDLYPLSESTYLIRIDHAELMFRRNDQGEVTSVLHHQEGFADSEGKKLKRD